jgi:hypothetical protein
LNLHHVFESFLIDRNYYQSPINIESTEKYIRVKDFIENINNLEKTAWRKTLLGSSGKLVGKNITNLSQ